MQTQSYSRWRGYSCVFGYGNQMQRQVLKSASLQILKLYSPMLLFIDIYACINYNNKHKCQYRW